ncbi:MAG: thioredoxin, partial [Deltaproteobacteria bacterium]|nr:thioredoxin [Deltaproteobacteria bacterium]
MESKNVVEVGDNNFESEIVSSKIPALVDFWGPMCGPCKALEPVIEKLAGDYQGRIKVAKVNVDASPMTAIQYAVKSLPTILLFNAGKVVDQLTGRASPAALEKF